MQNAAVSRREEGRGKLDCIDSIEIRETGNSGMINASIILYEGEGREHKERMDTPDIQSQGGENRNYFRRECVGCAGLIQWDDIVQTVEGDWHRKCLKDHEAETGEKIERLE